MSAKSLPCLVEWMRVLAFATRQFWKMIKLAPSIWTIKQSQPLHSSVPFFLLEQTCFSVFIQPWFSLFNMVLFSLFMSACKIYEPFRNETVNAIVPLPILHHGIIQSKNLSIWIILYTLHHLVCILCSMLSSLHLQSASSSLHYLVRIFLKS
jgi:hypothetical protein